MHTLTPCVKPCRLVDNIYLSHCSELTYMKKVHHWRYVELDGLWVFLAEFLHVWLALVLLFVLLSVMSQQFVLWKCSQLLNENIVSWPFCIRISCGMYSNSLWLKSCEYFHYASAIWAREYLCMFTIINPSFGGCFVSGKDERYGSHLWWVMQSVGREY